jgi:hypothetical protein
MAFKQDQQLRHLLQQHEYPSCRARLRVDIVVSSRREKSTVARSASKAGAMGGGKLAQLFADGLSKIDTKR